MKNFAEFIKANRAKAYALAEKNTKRNEDGDTVISRDDPWFYDDVWDNITTLYAQYLESTAID